MLIIASTYTFIYTKAKIFAAFYFSRFKVSLYLSIEAKHCENISLIMCFFPQFTFISLHEWHQPMLHNLKIMSLLVFKPTSDRKTTFLSFLLTISVRKALENRKTSRKQLITRPISNLMRQQTKLSFCTHNVCMDCLPVDFLHHSCAPFKTGGHWGKEVAMS